MTFQNTTAVGAARKKHVCECCWSPIPPGSPYLRLSGKWEGDFYDSSQHGDCRALWNALYNEWADLGEGMAFDLIGVFQDTGESQLAQESLNKWRGHFPHAVTRLEHRMRDWLEDGDEE